MSTQERGYLGRDRRVAADVVAVGEPSAHFDRLSIRRCDNADGGLAGTPVVRAIERDGSDRIAAESGFGFLFQPFTWLPSELHGLSVWLPEGQARRR